VVRTRNYKRFYNTRSAYGGDECSSTNRTALSKRKNQSTSVLQVLDMPENNYLKAVVLSGLFTLLFTEQATAASEVATGLQSFPFFGDLGDLSTGFASVRKISQQLPFLKSLCCFTLSEKGNNRKNEIAMPRIITQYMEIISCSIRRHLYLALFSFKEHIHKFSSVLPFFSPHTILYLRL